MQKNYNRYNYDTFQAKIYFSLIKVLKSKKKKLALILFHCLSHCLRNMIGWFMKTYLHKPVPWEKSKMFNITWKYLSIFNNKPPTIRVAHVTRDFLTCYSCCIIVPWYDRNLCREMFSHSCAYSSYLVLKKKTFCQ